MLLHSLHRLAKVPVPKNIKFEQFDRSVTILVAVDLLTRFGEIFHWARGDYGPWRGVYNPMDTLRVSAFIIVVSAVTAFIAWFPVMLFVLHMQGDL